jgi:hypothetical protein
MSATKPAKVFLAAALCLLPTSSVFALKTERLARAATASGKSSYLEVAGGSAIVRFKAGISSSAAASFLQSSGFKLLGTFERFNWSVVGLPDGMSVASGLNVLKNLPQVEWAEPNSVFRAKKVPNDTYVGRQYALAQVQAFGAWEFETGLSSRTTVAFVDTGIDGSHPELSGKVLTAQSASFNPDTGAPSVSDPLKPACDHATRAAGVAAASADNSLGVAGMSWGAKLLSLKVFADSDCTPDCSDKAGLNSCGTTEVAIAAAINDVISLHNSGATGKIIVNISLGSSGSCSDPLKLAINSAVSSGLILFAAAGNEGIGYIDSPASCPGVYAVGATDSQDKLASFSNSDTIMMTSGITAPGVELYTTDISSGYASASGTSFSSPMAAGLAALIWSAKPSYSAVQVWNTIKNSADDLGDPGPDRDFGWGRINALKALRLAVTGTSQFPGTSKAVAYPNPFRPKSQRLLTFTVPADLTGSGVEVKVYTSEGELVKKLDGLAWDGRNAAGAPVASGVYLFRIKTDKDAAVGRFALIR